MGFFIFSGNFAEFWGVVNFAINQKKIHQKFCFDIANQLLGGYYPNPNEPINPLPTAPKVDMLPTGNIWQ